MQLTSVKKPTWSLKAPDSSKAHNHVIIRNRVIEISDDDSDMEITPSPAPRLAAAKSQTPTADGLTSGITFYTCCFLR